MKKISSMKCALSSSMTSMAGAFKKLTVATLAVAALSSAQVTQAAPYASSLSNNTGVISFRLNESANSVAIIFTNLSGATVVSNLGPVVIGLTVTNLFVPGNFTVSVTNSAAPGWVSGISQQISNDFTNGTPQTGGISTNTTRFFAPRGLAINKNPASPAFGRIYVANAATGNASNLPPTVSFTTNRITYDGIYVLNADYSDTFGQGTNPLTAGLRYYFTNAPTAGGTEDGNSPWHLEVGEDNNLYISDFSSNNGCIFVTDPNVTVGTNVLAGFGVPGAPNSAPNAHHGRIGSSVIAKGSLANGNLVLYAIDSDNAVTSDGFVNHIMKWDIGAGPLPVDLTVTNQEQAQGGLPILLNARGLQVDLAAGPDGKFYMSENRAVPGTASGICVVDSASDTGSTFSAGGDGLWDQVYDSRYDAIGFNGGTNDFFYLTRAVAISPDGQYMVMVRDDNQMWVVHLINGIPDLSSRKLVANNSTLVTGRDICFDAANNMYTVSGGNDVLRTYSPGFVTIAQTSSAGTFTFTNILPATTVNITASGPNAQEPGGLGVGNDGTMTFTRNGDTSQPLTVNYTISGTATRGVDYVTNGASGAIAVINGSITFAAGDSSTNATIDVIDDNFFEPTETVTFTLSGSTNYLIGNSTAATVSIADDGDFPQVSITPRGLGSYELIPYRPAKFLLNMTVPYGSDVNIVCALSGTAVAGIDYTNFAFITNTMVAGQTNLIIRVTPIDNGVVAPDKTIIARVISVVGGTYSTNGVASLTATNILRNDDLSTNNLNTVYTEDFDADHTTSWLVKANFPADVFTDFFFDYSTVGIPPAPHSTGGSTRGLKMKAHLALASTLVGVSVSPIIAQGFTGDYRLRFDSWYNFNGPMDGTGVGSTEQLFAGVGGATTLTNGPFGAPSGNCVYFGYDAEGGQAAGSGFRDFNAYTNGLTTASQTPLEPASTGVNVWPAGATTAARDNATAYYAEFGDLTAPAAQLSVFPNNTRSTSPGMMGMCWHDVIITKTSTNVSWTVDGLLICTVNTANFNSLLSTNIFFGYVDPNTGSLPDNANAIFGLIDNVRVEQVVGANATLSSLTLTPGTLSPVFSSGTGTYGATNAFASNPVTVTAVPTDAGSTMQLSLNGGSFIPLTNGVASLPQTLKLSPPTNTLVVKVTAQDLVTTSNYTVNVKLQPSQTVPVLTNSFNGTALSFSWAADHIGYRLLTQTNALSTGLSTNWVAVPSAEATNSVTIPVSAVNPTVFYRLVYP